MLIFFLQLRSENLRLYTCLQIQNVLKGFVGGVMLVLSIHTVNLLLGCVHLSWPSMVLSYPSDESDVVNWLKVFAKMLLLVGQGIITATGVALVEELLFRSWLPDEIATDLGYYRGIIFSGLAFSVSQRYVCPLHFDSHVVSLFDIPILMSKAFHKVKWKNCNNDAMLTTVMG